MKKILAYSVIIKRNTLLLLSAAITFLAGCSASNDITFSSFNKTNPNRNNNGPSPSGQTVFRISSGTISGNSTDSSTIKANIYPMKKEKYISGSTSAEFTINAKRLNQ